MAQERKLPFGKIEPNSAKYFYSCMLGGIIGMVSPLVSQHVVFLLTIFFDGLSLW